ncbi:hypothetical protein ACFXJ8_43145 [Nonomuraea sp. NPDC059194]|uniref:hypothetical protein n=1 Tax=Nonomuraea sp. NPDC059194 TaxID=3346764 RepID=UPI00368A0756
MGVLAWIRDLLAFKYEQEPIEQHHQSRFSVRPLPSSLPEAYFEASLQLTWTIAGDGSPPNMEETHRVHRQLREVLERVTPNFSVLSEGEAQSEAEIAVYRQARGIDRRLTSVQINLSASDEMKIYAENFEKELRQSALTEATYAMKARQARYVRDHLLADAQIARLWWLDGRPEKLPDLLKMGNNFEQVVGLVRDGMGSVKTPDEALVVERMAEIIKDFLAPLGAQHREILLSQLSQIFGSYEREDLARNLQSLNGSSAGDS